MRPDQTLKDSAASLEARGVATSLDTFSDLALLTSDQTKALEIAAAEGLEGGLFKLMQAAGAAVAAVAETCAKQNDLIVVLCGPGANGGDGFIAAAQLAARGFAVKVITLSDPESMSGDAKRAFVSWTGDTIVASNSQLATCLELISQSACVIDAVFGIGLRSNLEGIAETLLRACENKRVIAVDVPSGVHADTGAVMGYAPKACATVTFLRPKPGHFLLPGRELCGDLHVADLELDLVEAISGEPKAKPTQWLNGPKLWKQYFKEPSPFDHKYSRGAPLIVGGVALTGAARLAARAAQRCGVGAVAVAAPLDSQTVYKVTLESALVQPFRDSAALKEQVEDKKVNAVLIGPGLGLVGATRERAAMVARSGKAAVIDADALSVFEGGAELLFTSVIGPVVLTPHEGEFVRVFPDLLGGRLIRARAAAARSRCVIVLKGFDTVVAAPDGRAVINSNAPPDLAVAGAGDVLSGIIVSLLAQGFPAFEAAAAAVWLHGKAANMAGRGMIAEDLIPLLPKAFVAVTSEQD